MINRFFLNLLAGVLVIVSSPNVPVFSAPDLTIVGFFESEGGIGKVPLTILETLDNKFTVNFVCTTSRPNLGNELSPKAIACINNPDHEDGKVAMLTELIWSRGSSPSDKMPKKSIVKLAYSMLETTQIPSKWVSILNEEFDAVIVPDIYVSRMYQHSGVEIPIFVLPLPMILDPYLARKPRADKIPKPFVFGDTSANKNPVPLIRAFAKAFRNDPDVLLLLRAGHLNRAPIDAIINKYKLNTVIVEEGKIPLEQFIDRLQTIDCFINLSRGEGFSYIPRECLALGLPTIITNNTASTTICDSGFVRPVPSNVKSPASSHYSNLFIERCGEQFDCTINDVVKALRDVYIYYPEYLEKARQGREWVKQYDCQNSKLQALYQNLIKPKKVLLGTENVITEESLVTNSKELYKKYLQVLKSE